MLTGSPTSRTVSNPQAGVWEVTVDARRTSDNNTQAGAPFTLTMSILGATVSPNPDIIPSATIGVPVARSYTLTNLYGAFTGRAVGTEARQRQAGDTDDRQPRAEDDRGHGDPGLDVAARHDRQHVRPGGRPRPVRLQLHHRDLRPGRAECGRRFGGVGDRRQPGGGPWKVTVDGYSVPAGSTTYKYVDVFANTAFGAVAVTDANALRAAGASWTVPGSVTANAAPAAGRVLLGNVQVRTDANVLVGQGDVIVENVVTP